MKSPLSFLPLASGFLVLVLSLAVGVLTVTSKGTSQQTATQAAQNSASLSLSPVTGDYTYTVGTSYPVGIIVNSGEKIVDGVDVIITFDPKKVKVIDTKISTTNLFETLPLNSVDNITGKIKLSALTFTAKPAVGIIGTFRYQPLSPGEVTFTFDFTSGSSTDSNIAQHGTAADILGKVDNANYVFK